jgi:hypothetical protein
LYNSIHITTLPDDLARAMLAAIRPSPNVKIEGCVAL